MRFHYTKKRKKKRETKENENERKREKGLSNGSRGYPIHTHKRKIRKKWKKK